MTSATEAEREGATRLQLLAVLVLAGFLLGAVAVWISVDGMRNRAQAAIAASSASCATGSDTNATVDNGSVSGQTLTLQIGGQTFSREIEGDPNAPVTIVEFSDYECPYCALVVPTLQQLLKQDAGQVRLIHLNFVVHPDAHLAALAGECAGEQGQYWKMHDAIFTQKQYNKTGLIQTAASIGLDTRAFESCLVSGKYEAALSAQQDAGTALNVDGTPTFIIGRVQDGKLVGTPLVGAQPISEFEKAVQAAKN